MNESALLNGLSRQEAHWGN